ncbi:MAG: DUF937 domain-containing protein [Clostridiales bacterium]|nr:DUF937 domain-containing protein [Clostridiales bacterium]
MDLTKTLIDSMTSIDSLSALTSRSNANPPQIKAAITKAIPGLMDSLIANTSTAEGASALLGALDQHTNSGSMRSQLAGADLVDGDKILSKILGGSKSDFITEVANASGLDFNQARTIMSSIAPAMLSSVAAANNTYKQPGAKSGIEYSNYPQTGSTGPTAAPTYQPQAQVQSQPAAGSDSTFKNVLGKLCMDEEDRQVVESLEGNTLLDNLKKFIL